MTNIIKFTSTDNIRSVNFGANVCYKFGVSRGTNKKPVYYNFKKKQKQNSINDEESI